MTETNTYQKAYEQAIKYLSIKMRSVGEMQEKLKVKKYPPKIIFQVLRELEDLRFLDDERYAQIFVENLKTYKNFGYYGIKQKLMQKKIPTDIVEQVLADFFSEEEELMVAKRFLNKLRRQGRKKYEQIARSFSSKGFRTEVMREILSYLPK